MGRKENIKEYSEAVISGKSQKAITLLPKLLPSKLYHYTSFSEFWHSKIIQGQLYLSDPAIFNDPYDCRIQGNTEFMLNQYFSEHNIPNRDEVLEGLRNGDTVLDYKGKKMTLSEYNEIACNEYKSKFHVSCLSEVTNSMLMWSHYADLHKGYAIELDARKIYENSYDRIHLRKVVYDKHPITMESLVNSIDKEAFLLCKSPAWKYEKEWRFFDMNKCFWDVSKYISAIYLGSRFDFKKHFFEAKAIQKHCQEIGAKLFQMKIDDTTYKLIPREITHSSILYLDL